MSGLLQGTVNLPGSKSESNRALMIAAYGGFPLGVEGLSDAHDTLLLKELLDGSSLREGTVDCQDAGSVARFLMTYLVGKPGTWILTGTERLCQRPMAPLIDALRQLGADITGECLPLRIVGKKLHGGQVTIDASLSSQFASSLLMAAPTWEQGLHLNLTGDPVSMPYLEMTIKMMEYFGVQVVREGNTISVAHQPYQPRSFTVSPDWSAASYWYEMMALGEGGELLLKGLNQSSLQGDSVAVEMFAKLGVKTDFVSEGARISKMKNTFLRPEKPLVFDFNNTPDLFPSVFVTCISLNINSIFIGISTLYNKESDRIKSLITELSKIYTFINIVTEDKIIIEKSTLGENRFDIKDIVFNTYNDHRIAMSLAALRPKLGKLQLDDPSVVNKSFPRFWEEWENCF